MPLILRRAAAAMVTNPVAIKPSDPGSGAVATEKTPVPMVRHCAEGSEEQPEPL